MEALEQADLLLSPIANLAGAIGGIVLLYVGLMRFSPRFRSRMVLWPISRRRARRAGVDEPTQEHLRAVAARHVRGETTRPGDLLGDLLRVGRDPASTQPWSEWSRELATLVEEATRPDRATVAARLLVPEQVKRLDDLLTGLGELLSRFDRVTQVSLEAALRPPAPGAAASAHFASALSGAAVLVDAGGARSRTADSVIVWADTSFRDDRTLRKDQKTYGDVEGALGFDEHSRLGDYNGRLVELNAVSLASNSREGEVAFVMETTETSYRATEPPSSLAAKGLFPAATDPRLPVFSRGERATYRRQESAVPRERTCPVTSYVSLMTHSPPSEGVTVLGLPDGHVAPVDMLVLCRRSAATRNGAGTLSATAGGVVELDQRFVRLDSDRLGAPDITGSVLRETAEELGIPRRSITLAPVATFVATVNGYASLNPRRGAGQLVACVLHLGSTSLGLRGIVEARHHANAARGAFEVERLEAIAMLPGAEGLERFAATVRQHADRLDQHGLLSCYYAALRLYSEDVSGAFSRAFDSPWWAIPWQGETERQLRVVRDVRSMMPDDSMDIERAVPRWSAHWAGMPGLLGQGVREQERSDAE